MSYFDLTRGQFMIAKFNVMRSVLFLILLLLFSCKAEKKKEEKPAMKIDLEEIRERGKLRAVTSFNSTNYFIYRGQPMGYQYELLNQLANHLDMELELLVSNELKKSFDLLQTGECDIIASNLTITKERKKFISFTTPYMQTRQVLVQRKPDNWEYLTKMEVDLSVIRNQLNLAGKAIFVQENSSHVERLKNLSEEIGDSINIIEVPEESEQLIAMVANGEIDFTICDEVVAKVNQTYYPNIDIQTAISFPQYLAWAVRKDSEQLLSEINRWLKTFEKTMSYAYINARYFQNHKSQIVHSEYFPIVSGRISDYDEIIKKYSKEIGWDWRLIASLIFQESNFNPEAVSWAGAFGLMQLMPATADIYGVDKSSSPQANIKAGIYYLKYLEDALKDEIEDDEERVKFILASYNAGIGHIYDARKLAVKFGKNPDLWNNNVDYFILNKSNPKYYSDSVSQYGYLRGTETYNYVYDILERYDHYKNILEEDG